MLCTARPRTFPTPEHMLAHAREHALARHQPASRTPHHHGEHRTAAADGFAAEGARLTCTDADMDQAQTDAHVIPSSLRAKANRSYHHRHSFLPTPPPPPPSLPPPPTSPPCCRPHPRYDRHPTIAATTELRGRGPSAADVPPCSTGGGCAGAAACPLAPPQEVSGAVPTLTELLSACRAAPWRHSDIRSTAALRQAAACLTALLHTLPSEMQLSGNYVSQYVMRKILWVAAGENPMDWEKLPLAELRLMCPDHGRFLDAFPQDWSADDLHNLFDCSPLLISMWACLWKAPADSWPADELLHAIHEKRFFVLQARVDAYKAQHGIPPCPYLLLKGTDPFHNMTKGRSPPCSSAGKSSGSRVRRRPSSA